MPYTPILLPRFKRCMVLAIAVAAICAALSSNASAQTTASTHAQTTWTITIDATGPGPKPAGYTVDFTPKTGGCPLAEPPSPTPNPTSLSICENDIVQWVAVTRKNASGNMKSEMSVFHEHTILLDPNYGGKPNQAYHASDGQPTQPATVDPNASVNPNVSHEYYVAVFDKVGRRWYVDDPKIIIGGVGIDELIALIKKECSEQHQRAHADASDKTTVSELCKQVEDLENRLNLNLR
jgi:hypothetical protein